MASNRPLFWRGHGSNEITERQRAILSRPEQKHGSATHGGRNHGILSRRSIPGVSAACDAGNHSRCTKEACTCVTCNHNRGIL